MNVSSITTRGIRPRGELVPARAIEQLREGACGALVAVAALRSLPTAEAAHQLAAHLSGMQRIADGLAQSLRISRSA